jgi:hypothetical protein
MESKNTQETYPTLDDQKINNLESAGLYPCTQWKLSCLQPLEPLQGPGSYAES